MSSNDKQAPPQSAPSWLDELDEGVFRVSESKTIEQIFGDFNWNEADPNSKLYVATAINLSLIHI